MQASSEAYKADPDFGLAAAGAIDARASRCSRFGDDAALSRGAACRGRRGAGDRCAGDAASRAPIHIAAYPAYFGKENELVGAVVMAWDLSIHRAAIIGQQMVNGLIALGIAVVGMALLAAFLMRRVTRPLRKLTKASTALAEGDLEVEIEGADRGDELGDMARAVEVFRENSRQGPRR